MSRAAHALWHSAGRDVNWESEMSPGNCPGWMGTNCLKLSPGNVRKGKCWEKCVGNCLGIWGITVPENVQEGETFRWQILKSLHVATMICATLVNAQTHTQRQTDTQLWTGWATLSCIRPNRFRAHQERKEMPQGRSHACQREAHTVSLIYWAKVGCSTGCAKKPDCF